MTDPSWQFLMCFMLFWFICILKYFKLLWCPMCAILYSLWVTYGIPFNGIPCDPSCSLWETQGCVFGTFQKHYIVKISGENHGGGSRKELHWSLSFTLPLLRMLPWCWMNFPPKARPFESVWIENPVSVAFLPCSPLISILGYPFSRPKHANRSFSNYHTIFKNTKIKAWYSQTFDIF